MKSHLKSYRLILLLWIGMLLAGCAGFGQTSMPTPTPIPLSPEEMADEFEYAWREVSFDDLIPDDLDVELAQCWNGMGMDDQGRIYIGFTSFRDGGKSEDFVVFRYDPASDKREYLGSFQDIAAANGNLQEGESIPKGHTRMIFADGVMYMGSQGFHDFKQEIDDLPNYRGSHIFAYDTRTESWLDLSANLPGGVVTEHQGIVGLNILRSEGLLVGLVHPHSDLALYDYKNRQLVKVVPGIPWELGNPLSREVIVAPSGNIYSYRGTEQPFQRWETHPVWVYNIQTGEMKQTEYNMTNGFWIGQTETRDGSKMYVTTVNGQLYEFDTVTETFKDLGYMLPSEDIAAGRLIQFQYGPTLSPDETKLLFVLSTLEHPQGTGELYEYDIATGKVTYIQQLPIGIYTSADLRDDKNIYLAHFGSQEDLWSGRVRLMVITVTPEP
jgi:hypothetical protein